MKSVLVVACFLLVSSFSEAENIQPIPEDWSLRPDVIKLIKSADVQYALQATKKKALINKRDAKGITPLIHAAQAGNLELVRALIQKGSSANERKPNGSTALIAAVQSGNDLVVGELISAGADIEATTLDGKISAVFQAVALGQHRSFERLLKAGANPNPELSVASLLCVSMLAGNDYAASQLLKFESAYDAQYILNNTCAIKKASGLIKSGIAVSDNFRRKGRVRESEAVLRITKLLFDRAKESSGDINFVFKEGIVSYALDNRGIELVKYMIEGGVGLNIKDTVDDPFLNMMNDVVVAHSPELAPIVNTTVLDRILKNYGVDVFKGLYESGVEVSSGRFSFERFVKAKKYNDIKDLVGMGFDLNKKDPSGNTAIGYALDSEDREMALFLINNGADINGSSLEEPYLHKFIRIAAFSNVDLMLGLGADPNIQNSEGQTPIHVVHLNLPQKPSIDVIDKKGLKNMQKEGYSWSKSKYFEALVSAGADLDIADNSGLNARQVLGSYQREDSEADGFDWAKAAALGVGFVAGGGLELDAEAQAKAISGIVQDSQAGVDGVSNTVGALNNAAARYEANSKSPISGATSADVKSSVPAKKNYLSIAGRSDLLNCGLPDVQTNSMCLTANKYYERYVAVVEGGQDGRQMYQMHQTTARQLIDWLRRSKPKTVLDLETPSNGRYVKQKKNDYTVVNKPVEACANPVERCVTGPNGKSCWTDCGEAAPATGSRAGSVRE